MTSGQETERVNSYNPGARRRVRVCFDPLNVTFFNSKLLLDNSASFTLWRMKDLCQKMEGKTDFFRDAWNSLMPWPDWPWPPYFTTDLRHLIPTCLIAGLRSSWYSARLARRDLKLRPVDVLGLCTAAPCITPTQNVKNTITAARSVHTIQV